MTKIILSGIVGDDFTANGVRDALTSAGGGPVEIEIASPGGYVTPGLEISSVLRAYSGPKTVHITGICASMASFLAASIDGRVVAEYSSVYMVHECRGGAFGRANDLRDEADAIETFTRVLAEAYSARSGKSIAEVRRLMAAETFYTAREAKAAGFIDEVRGGIEDPNAITRARTTFAEAQARMNASGYREDAGKIAACIASMKAPEAPRNCFGVPVVDGIEAWLAKGEAEARAEVPLTDAEKAQCMKWGITENSFREYTKKGRNA